MYRKQMHEDDQPIIAKKQVKDNYIHDLKQKHFAEPMEEKFIKDDRKINGGGLMRQQSERYRHATDRGHTKFMMSQSYDNYERENLTDRQKYREIIETKKYEKISDSPPRHEMYRKSNGRDDKRDYSPENTRTIQRKSKVGNDNHGHAGNPYREPESLPYRESIESMMKSPVMKYKSRHGYETRSSPQENYPVDAHAQRRSSRDLYIKDSSPMSTMKRTSPKDRFQDAKEKFQAMDKLRMQKEKESMNVRRSEPDRRRDDKDYRQSYSPEPRYHIQNEWSSEEEFSPNVREYNMRDLRGHQRHHQQQQRMVAPAKSLGNLAKGYRHSYAEPMKYCNRVGLAAIEPY